MWPQKLVAKKGKISSFFLLRNLTSKSFFTIVITKMIIINAEKTTQSTNMFLNIYSYIMQKSGFLCSMMFAVSLPKAISHTAVWKRLRKIGHDLQKIDVTLMY